ncbi:hypothetical protein BH10PLA2_BH10PLA2_34840 [soil metagenome]
MARGSGRWRHSDKSLRFKRFSLYPRVAFAARSLSLVVLARKAGTASSPRPDEPVPRAVRGSRLVKLIRQFACMKVALVESQINDGARVKAGLPDSGIAEALSCVDREGDSFAVLQC